MLLRNLNKRQRERERLGAECGMRPERQRDPKLCSFVDHSKKVSFIQKENGDPGD